MKRLFIILMCVMSMAQSFADTVWQKVGRVSYRKIKLGTGSSATVHRAPYYGDLVTSDYDVSAALLTLWFHYAAEDAEVIITCDGETIADVTLGMEANERLELDFSGCEIGEYTVSVAANGELQVVGTFCVYK